jgi:hypothetical protein
MRPSGYWRMLYRYDLPRDGPLDFEGRDVSRAEDCGSIIAFESVYEPECSVCLHRGSVHVGGRCRAPELTLDQEFNGVDEDEDPYCNCKEWCYPN